MRAEFSADLNRYKFDGILMKSAVGIRLSIDDRCAAIDIITATLKRIALPATPRVRLIHAFQVKRAGAVLKPEIGELAP